MDPVRNGTKLIIIYNIIIKMNQDTLHSILIHVDIAYISDMCLVNKMILNIISQYYFWYQFFIKNNLIMLYNI